MNHTKQKHRHSTKTLAIRGVLFNWLGRGCSFAITFIATPIILSSLGNEAYGLWAIVMSVGSYYALADVGMQAACTKFISEFEAKGDRDSTNRLYATATLLYSLLALAVLLAAMPIAYWFPRVFEIKQLPASDVQWAVFLTGASVAIKLQAQVFSSTIRALKRFDIANVISVGVQLLQAALTIWVVVRGHGLLGMAWVLVGMTLVGRVAEAYCASRLLGGLKAKFWSFDREMFQQLFRFSAWNVGGQLAGRMHQQSAPFIIGMLLGPASVPFFSLANSLITKGQSLTQAITSVVMPVASELNAQKREVALLRIAVLSARATVSLAVAGVVVVLFFGRSFIELWLGPEYGEPVAPVLLVLCLGFVADMTSGGIRSVLAGINRVDLVTKVNSICAVITTILGAVLTWQMGVIGMAWAVLLSSIVVNMFICPMLTCQLVGCSWTKYMHDSLLRPVIAAIPGLLLGFLLVELLGTPLSFSRWFLMASSAGTVVAASTFFLCLDRDLRWDLLSTLGFNAPKLKPEPAKSE